MLKLLRKYNKWILVIGGSLLMVAFLAPGAITRCGFNPANKTVARIGGEKISAMDYEVARRQLAALEDYFPFTVNEGIISGEDRVTHWLMLGRAAREAGFVGEKADGVEWATGELAELRARQFVMAQWLPRANNNPQLLQYYILSQPENRAQFEADIQAATAQIVASFEEQHDMIARRVNLTPDQLDEALSTVRGIWRMLESYMGAARLSDRRAIVWSESHRDEAFVDAAVIPASAVIDEVSEPTDEEIAAQFEAYKDVRPGEGEYGVGYLFPPRVKLNYMTISRQAIAGAIELDPVEVNKFWMQNRDQFAGEFANERGRVEAVMTNRIVENVKSLAHQAVLQEVAQATSRLSEDEAGYRILPEDWSERRPTLAEIAPVVVEQVREGTKSEPIRNPDAGITIPLPEVTVIGAEYRTEAELRALTGIGRSTAQIGPRTVGFPELALKVRAIGGDSPDVPIQVDVPVTQTRLEDTRGNRYYFTITDARGESPPDSPDVIREQLVEDARQIAAFKLLAERVDEFRSAAVEGGLTAVADLFAPAEPEDPEAAPPVNPVQIREQVRVGEFGTTPAYPAIDQEPLRLAVLEVAETLDPLRPVDEVPIADRTVGVPVPQERSVVVARIVGLNPLTVELYRAVAESDVREAKSEEISIAVADGEIQPFSFDALAKRLDFRYVGSRAEEEEAEQAAGAEG